MSDTHDHEHAGLDAEQLDDEVVIPDTKWPKVIGVISLLYACCGFLCTSAYTAMTFLSGFFMKLGGMTPVDIPLVLQVQALGQAAINFVLGIIMISGSIGLLRRRRGGVVWLKRWVILRLLMLVIGVGLVFVSAPVQMGYQRQMLDAQNEMLRQQGMESRVQELSDEDLWRRMLIGTAVFTGLLAVYPVFLGLFISRAKVADEIDQWV